MSEALRFPWGDEERPRGGEASRGGSRPPAGGGGRSVRRQASRAPVRRAGASGRRPGDVTARSSAAGEGGWRPLFGPLRVPSGEGRSTAGTRDLRPPGSPRLGAMAIPRATALAPLGWDAARDAQGGRITQGPQRERHEPDHLLIVGAVALTAVGILMVYSSRGVKYALDEGGSVFDAVAFQLLWAVAGGLALLVTMRMDYRYLRHVSVLGFAVAVGLLVLVLMPEVPPLIEPVRVGGAARWLRVGSLPPFHPAELAKLALIVFLAHWFASRGAEVSSLRRGTIPFLLWVGPVIGLIALEPDLGTTGVVTLTAFTMFFVAGASLWQLALLVPAGIAAVAVYIQTNEYQLQRVQTFLDPWSVEREAGYQTVLGIYALAVGGVTGIGLGESRPQAGGLPVPNADNDFIFAIVGQEFGFIGGLTVIALFVLLAWRGVRIALAAPDTFGALLAVGITSWLAFQAFINIGVVINLLPLTGLPLPFVSDGGTSLVVSLAAVGILLAISRETIPRGSGSHEDRGGGGRHRRPHLPRLGRGEPAGRAAG